jgi:hypothetical protein
MDADLPTSDRVDLDPPEVGDETVTTAAAAPGGEGEPATEQPLDLDAIEADLAGVEVALARLGDGTYWTDEVTGEPLPDDVLAASPTARRA